MVERRRVKTGERRVPSHGANVKDAKNAASGDAAYNKPSTDVGRVPTHGVPTPSHGEHEFTRIKRAWRWQDGYHDHKFRTPESETRKWEYVCLNPVRAGLVKRPEEWPFGGEIFYDEAGGPRLVRGTPPLLETGMLMEEEDGGTTPNGHSSGRFTKPARTGFRHTYSHLRVSLSGVRNLWS